MQDKNFYQFIFAKVFMNLNFFFDLNSLYFSVLFIRLLALTVDLTDDNYLPEKIVVLTGESEDFKELSTVNINW